MKETISAMMDGELEDPAAGTMIDTLRRDGEAAEAWRVYHLISDAMRDTGLMSQGFAARVGERLAGEPTVLAPLPGGPRQRFALAAAASLAAVALVAWLAFAPVPKTELAQAPKAPVVIGLPAHANDYLLAHQGFSPRVSLQGMAPYVRTVSEQADETGK
jgi:sigma-E factor negative regulatory protein RseA